MVKLVHRKHIHMVATGFLFAIYFGVRALTSLYVSGRVKKWRPKQAYVAGLTLQAVSLFLFGAADSVHDDKGFVATALFLRALEGVAAALASGGAQTFILHLFPGRDIRMLSLFDMAFALGNIAGPFPVERLYKVSVTIGELIEELDREQ
jgi:MFS family permease